MERARTPATDSNPGAVKPSTLGSTSCVCTVTPYRSKSMRRSLSRVAWGRGGEKGVASDREVADRVARAVIHVAIRAAICVRVRALRRGAPIDFGGVDGHRMRAAGEPGLRRHDRIDG